MAMHWINKVSYGAVGVAAVITTGFVTVAGNAIRAVSDVVSASTPTPFAPMSHNAQLQLVGGNGLPVQLMGLHFEPKERVNIFVLPASEAPLTQYALWIQVDANETGQFTKDVNVALPANTPGTFYLSAVGKRGYVAPIGPLNTAKAEAPKPVAVNFQPTLVPAAMPTLQPTPTPKSVNTDPVGEYYVTYHNNRDLGDTPIVTRNEAVIDANWGLGGPAGLKPDNFSVSFYGKFQFKETENYEFVLLADDGVRLWVDDEMVVNDWRVSPCREIRVDVPLTRGDHRVRLEYFDSVGSAQVRLTWSVDYSRWEARYYNSTDWTGPVMLKRDDGDADGRLRMVNWGDGSPGQNVKADNFSVSWERRAFFDVGGEYKFTLDLDDGAKVYIDNVEMFNSLNAVGTHEFTHKIARGRHLMQVMYVEYGGGAKMKLEWTLIPPTPAPVP